MVAALLCIEVRKHHLNRVAIWHCDAPVTVLVVGVILRVLWARKSTRVLATDGRWATCGHWEHLCFSTRRHKSISLNCRMRDMTCTRHLLEGQWSPSCITLRLYCPNHVPIEEMEKWANSELQSVNHVCTVTLCNKILLCNNACRTL